MIMKKSTKENAVSPVVGVMLMLVVTIIIAAVVATFASGMVDSTDKTPVAIVTGTYSQENGLYLTMQSGDPIYLNDVDLVVKPSSGFSDSYAKLAWDVETVDKAVLSPGETVQAAVVPIQGTAMVGTTYANTSKYYGFNYYPDSIGKSFTLLMIKDGTTFATTEVRITA